MITTIEVNDRIRARARWARIAKLTACVPFFPEFDLMCQCSYEWRIHENRPGEVGGGPPFAHPVRAEHFIHYPVHILLFFFRFHVPSNRMHSRVRATGASL